MSIERSLSVSGDSTPLLGADCEAVIRELTAYTEGEASPNLVASIESHMKGCRNCEQLLSSMRKMLEFVGDEAGLLAAFDHIEKR